ncbi:META domain [Chryseobacterium taihuense]|uniref:META domain n=2 Tax=Chryseobacterium group TaxID=2782232 RepID=A0A4U8WD76_9FLAO|nr:META domain [Chryseobacterium taihuense]
MIYLCFCLCIGCASVNGTEQHIHRQWMLVSYKDFPKEDLMNSKAEINLTKISDAGKIAGTAFMGCNRMFFNAEIKSKKRIEISGLGSTLMACEKMELESQFSKDFEKMKNFVIEGHFLTLYDEKGNKIKFVAADWD